MKKRTRNQPKVAVIRRPDRRSHQLLRLTRLVRLGLVLLIFCAGAGAAATPGLAQEAGGTEASSRTLYLAEVQLVGAGRTSVSTVYRHLSLEPGQAIDQALLVERVAELRASGLFNSVAFYTRPGAERGHLVLVLEVTEHNLDFRWAAGNTDLDGWYLSPAMLAYDNIFGKGGFLDLQWRIGFRHTGLLMRYGRPPVGSGRNYWGAKLFAMITDRPYFSDGLEYRHEVTNTGVAGVWGRHFGSHSLLEFGLKIENVDVADFALAQTVSPDGTIGAGDKIPLEDLPASIAASVGQDDRAIVTLDWQYDTRAEEKRAGSPISGLWGRVKGSLVGQTARNHAGIQADLRAFKNAPGGVLAARLRTAWVGDKAAFYDRLYLGGMYSVRGFPSNSLSAPAGDTWLWSGSLEYRSQILGDSRGTKLAGVFFLDAGASGATDEPDPSTGVAVGAGYGLRLRVWWLDWIGLDVGFPITERPIDMRFQVTGSIGWSF